MLPEMIAVKSSAIKAIGYDQEAKELFITFNWGATYQYSGFPPEEYEALMAAESIGRHFIGFIKSRYGANKL